MSSPKLAYRYRCLGVLSVAVLLLHAASMVHADATTTESALRQLRQRIEVIEHDLNDSRGRRDAVREELRDLEQQIGASVSGLRHTDGELGRSARGLTVLRLQARTNRKRLDALRERLAAEIRVAHRLDQSSTMKLLLNQQQPATLARMATYHRYVHDARARQITATRVELARLDALETKIENHVRALRELRAERAHEQKAIEEARARRAQLLARLDRRVRDQSVEIDQLRTDRQRLERLLTELVNTLASNDTGSSGNARHIATRRGQLPPPVTGRLVARFGDPKDVGDLTWRGIFLAAPEGRSVTAVHEGRVAYAGWLRGLGLLLILDHGNGYMTLYGHNQSVLRRVGDRVEAGEPIAITGSTGDAPETGVYFEIRRDGEPDDPLRWCKIASIRNRP